MKRGFFARHTARRDFAFHPVPVIAAEHRAQFFLMREHLVSFRRPAARFAKRGRNSIKRFAVRVLFIAGHVVLAFRADARYNRNRIVARFDARGDVAPEARRDVFGAIGAAQVELQFVLRDLEAVAARHVNGGAVRKSVR